MTNQFFSPRLPSHRTGAWLVSVAFHFAQHKYKKKHREQSEGKEKSVMTVSIKKRPERKFKQMLHKTLIQTSNGEKCHASSQR